MGGRADSSRPAAEVPRGGIKEARAGARGKGDSHCRAGAKHHHPSALPGEATCGEQAGQVPPQPP